jgi:Beta-ketoacyl synthase, N-terminal domain
MIHIWLSGVGILGPGLDGWAQTLAILQRRQPFVPGSVNIPAPALLPLRDRRRCSDTVSLALYVAQQTAQAGGLDLTTTPSVFANSAGDGQVVHALLSALARPGKPVSPTDFHNSVHNAPAFYWSLGAGSHAASTSIAAARFTFAAALLKAGMHCVAEGTPILMVCFDKPLPAPLSDTYPFNASLAVGFALWPRPVDNSLAELRLSWVSNVDARSESWHPLLPELAEALCGNPAEHALPLLQAIASESGRVLQVQGAHDAALRIDIACP